MAGRKPELNGPTMKRIYDHLCNGDSMTTVARKLGVVRGTIYRWMQGNEKFKDMVKEAREIQAGTLVDEMLDIADDDSKDLISDASGRQYPNAAAVARAKLKLDTRRKLAGYYNPAAYSDQAKLDITSNGESLSGFGGLIITPPKEEEEE